MVRATRRALAVALLLIVPTWAGAQGCSCDSGDTTESSASGGAGGGDAGSDADAGPTLELVWHVDPFLGTDDSSSPHPVPGGAGGSTYPGAVVPFGMVQLSPDTPTASPSGYRYGDGEIEQFSLTHFDGAGCPNNEDLPFLPIVGDFVTSPGTTWSTYRSGYRKASESASPGFYGVTLDRYGIGVELTATTRTGLVRFTYPATASARLLLHTGRSATGDRDGSLEIVAPDRLRGTVTAGGFCGSTKIFPLHFAVAFDRPFTAFGTWLAEEMTPGQASVSGSPSGGWVSFYTGEDVTVQMQIALSYVSVANAEANLAAESTGWDFDATREAAAARWEEVLGRVRVTGGTDDELRQLYTALYHVFQSPNVASDVNGEYLGFDNVVHSATRPTYRNFSGWDIIRSWTHLLGALAPEAPDILASMVQDGVEGGLLPFWTHESVETNVMVGDPGTVNVANAYAMGVRGFDAEAALALAKKSADEPLDTQRWGLGDWIDLHFVGNAAISLEYAMADFALAQFAQALGDDDGYLTYLERSAYWAESWNVDDGYLEPRVGSVAPGTDAARIYEVEVFGSTTPGTNLAEGGAATSSGSCSAGEGPGQAANGTWNGGSSDKWCDNGSPPRWWQVDLGSLQNIDQVVIHHAGAGGESTAWNTRDFTISVSADAATWSVVADVTGNAASTTTHDFSAVDARHVKLEITASIQGGTPGDWDCQPFDPAAECGYIEGNGAQYLWMVPHDQAGLFALMGGNETAVNRLDELFTELNAGTERPYFYIGNEPEHGTPWSYAFAAAPWKTQQVVRRIVQQEFSSSPGGLPGNDDLGATSAWLVWAYLGLYPMIPGTDVLVVHGPVFPSATVQLASGGTLTINATGAGADAPYVQSLSVDGTLTTQSWVRYAELAGGATLDFVMGGEPNTAWGSGVDDLPPSFPP